MEYVQLVWCEEVTSLCFSRKLCDVVQSNVGDCSVVACDGPIPWVEGGGDIAKDSGWRGGAEVGIDQKMNSKEQIRV